MQIFFMILANKCSERSNGCLVFLRHRDEGVKHSNLEQLINKDVVADSGMKLQSLKVRCRYKTIDFFTNE